MKRSLSLAVLIGCLALLGSCSSLAYLSSDDYLQSGIRITADPKPVSGMRAANQWSVEFAVEYSGREVGVWAANRLANQGRRDVVVLVERISSFDPPGRDINQSQNMWRISVYEVHPQDKAQ
jgi:hypothetical protein